MIERVKIPGALRSAHLARWARIETRSVLAERIVGMVAPTLRGGRGLKPGTARGQIPHAQVAPTLRGGRGLKHACVPGVQLRGVIAPTLRGGRGLKPCYLGLDLSTAG